MAFLDKKLDIHLLSINTPVSSGYEENFKRALIKEGITVYYQLEAFPISNQNLRKAYLPDFITNLFIKQELLIIEPHGSVICSKEHLEKIRDFRNEYKFYVVFASDVSVEFIESKFNIKMSDYTDEFWHIENDISEGGAKKSEDEVIQMLELKKKEAQLKSETEVLHYLYPRIEIAERIKELRKVKR
jgi:hypothetical protein